MAARIGVLGGGSMAQTHLRSLLSIPGVEVAGVSAPERSAAVAATCERAGITVRDDADWLLGDCGLDAVVVATPTDSHADLVVAAAEAGIHVFCEKPLARTAARARAAAAACAECGVKLAVGHVVRYFAAYSAIRAAIGEGRIGPPAMARCRRVSAPPAHIQSWYADAARSGGVIMDLGVHDFDWLRWVLGPVTRVSALESPLAPGRLALVSLAHSSGAASSVLLSWMDPKGFATSMEVRGPRGRLRHDSRARALLLDLWPGAARPELPAEAPERDPYRRELEDALRWFAGGTPPRCDGRDGVAAVALAEAAQLSVATRAPVAVADEGGAGTAGAA